jgi:hypothetical protein
MKTSSLPEMTFRLHPFDLKKTQESLYNQIKTLKRLTIKTGTGSQLFRKNCQRLINLAEHGEKKVAEQIRTALDARSLTFLWLSSDNFLTKCKVSELLVHRVFAVRNRISMLTFSQLIRLYFQRFDQCGDLQSLVNGIHKGFKQLGKGRLPNDLVKLETYRSSVIYAKGPAQLAKEAYKRNINVGNLFIDKGIKNYSQGRFADICHSTYYLEQLNDLKPGEASDVLTEVIIPAVYNLPYDTNRLLGHEILKILIDKSPITAIHENWQNVIMAIAGDPRIPKTHQKYELWWRMLGEERINKMISWLSKLDLKLFLEILDEYGTSSNRDDLQRMFPARKEFLDGLFNQELIQGSRLFVNSSMERFLKRHYDVKNLPKYAKISGGPAAIIYLNVGGIHMIEGSHNFYMWIYKNLPRNNPVYDYGRDWFDSRELGLGLSELNASEAGSDPYRVRHMPQNLNWQNQAIKALWELDIAVDPEKIFSKPDYRLYKQRYGILY